MCIPYVTGEQLRNVQEGIPCDSIGNCTILARKISNGVMSPEDATQIYHNACGTGRGACPVSSEQEGRTAD